MLKRFNVFVAATIVLLSSSAQSQPANFKPCPFTAAELQTALGVKFSEGKADPPINAGTVSMQTCQYDSKNYSLSVQSQVYQNAADAKKAVMPMAGRMVAIPNDPDGAVFQEGQGDLTAPAVHYARGNVATNMRIMGIYYKDAASKKAAMLAMREKLAKLRRVP
jgi:hypothetical protein